MRNFVAIILVLLAVCTTAAAEVTMYGRAAIIVDLDRINDIVTVEDAVGFLWEFDGCEDYEIGDLVVMIMLDMGEPGYICDDMVLSATYSGYVAADMK